MAASNFNQLKFKSGMCTRLDVKNGGVTQYDYTPDYARKEEVNLTRITSMKKLGMSVDNLDVLEELGQ